jgi:hypothetical protein
MKLFVFVGTAAVLAASTTAAQPAAQDIPGFRGTPLKVQFWDATHNFTAATGDCVTGLVGISDSMKQETAANCPGVAESLGHVTPCNPHAASAQSDGLRGSTVAASGAVIKAPIAETVTYPGVEDLSKCLTTVADKARHAGAVWYQDLETTQGAGTSANHFFGAPELVGGFQPESGWGGVQFSWVTKDGKHVGMDIKATGGGKYGPELQPNVFLCPTATFKDVDCVLASLFGVTGEPLPNVEIGSNGAYNVYFVSSPEF